MFRFPRWLFCAALTLGVTLGPRLAAQPALTTIQDTLYTANGNFFNGVITITWQSFEAGDTSNIAAQVTRLSISNGNLYVQLVPTTTANTPATYAVQYNSSGHTQYNEVWVVPPSTTPLRVRDVRLSAGAVSTPGPAADTSAIQIANVVGLQSALNLRPTMGVGFTASKTAVIDAMGGIDGAVGNASDCMHVDGSSGACGTASASGNTGFVDAETPSGTLNGVNTTFTLANTPSPATSLLLYRNGMLQDQNFDYTLAGSTITFQSGAVPRSPDILLAYYRVSVSISGVGFVDDETPAGTINGSNSAFTLANTPNPSTSLALYRNGILLKPGLDYTLSGNSITFSPAMIPQMADVLLCSYRIAQ